MHAPTDASLLPGLINQVQVRWWPLSDRTQFFVTDVDDMKCPYPRPHPCCRLCIRHPLPRAALLLILALQAKFGVPLNTRVFLCSQRLQSCGCHR